MRALLILAFAATLSVQSARGGSWTLDSGQFFSFTGVTASSAGHNFDHNGKPADHVVFKKILVQNWTEYGLTDAVTLFAAPEYVTAETDMGHDALTRVNSASFEAGARILLLSRFGMLSLQGSGKTAGAFDMSVSASGQSGHQAELRLLYGREFRFFRRDGFLDLEAAQRWIQRPRPNEIVFDATAGWWFAKDYLLMAQSFNTISSGATGPPYRPYRLHKLQASLVQRVTSRWSLQSGYFFAVSGRNIVQEQGFLTTIWYRA